MVFILSTLWYIRIKVLSTSYLIIQNQNTLKRIQNYTNIHGQRIKDSVQKKNIHKIVRIMGASCQKGFLKKVASKLRPEGQGVCTGCRWEQEKCLVGNKWLRWLRIHLQCRRSGLDPWILKVPWRREWQPTPVFLPGESQEQRSLEGYSPWGCKESDATEWLTHTQTDKQTDRHRGEKRIIKRIKEL